MLYAYAVVDSNRKIEDRVEGIEREAVRNIPCREIGLAVGEIEGTIDGVDGSRALKHEEVVEKLMEKFTVLPMRFGTVFPAPADALAALESGYDLFRRNLERVRGKAEWGLRVIWDGGKTRDRLANAPGPPPALDATSSRAKQYLEKKRVQRRLERAFAEEAEEHIARVDGFFAGRVAEKRLEKLKRDKLLLNAYYLVRRESQSDFIKAYQRLRRESGDLRFLLSGPWPPYNFVERPRAPARGAAD